MSSLQDIGGTNQAQYMVLLNTICGFIEHNTVVLTQ